MLAALGIAVATQFAITRDAGVDRVGIGFLVAVLIFHAGITLTPKTPDSGAKLSVRTEVLLLGGIIAVAAFLRVWRIGDFPSGIYVDEANNWIDAIGIIEGDHFELWSSHSSGRPTLYVYLLSAIFWVFGASEMALRSLPIMIGVATVGAFYLLARLLLGQIRGWQPRSCWPSRGGKSTSAASVGKPR